jgi:hypothetical protein
MYRKFGKRLFDLAMTVPVLILLSPVIAALALLVRLKLGSPVLFRQRRPGLYGRPFTIYKFRTMSTARDMAGKLLPDEQRIAAFVHFRKPLTVERGDFPRRCYPDPIQRVGRRCDYDNRSCGRTGAGQCADPGVGALLRYEDQTRTACLAQGPAHLPRYGLRARSKWP